MDLKGDLSLGSAVLRHGMPEEEAYWMIDLKDYYGTIVISLPLRAWDRMNEQIKKEREK